MFNKKNLLILFFIILIILGIFFITYSSKNNNSSKELTFYSIRSGYLNIKNSDKETIIKKSSELKKYCELYNHYTYDGQGNIISGTLDDLLDRYDNEYFKENSLALKYVEVSSSGDLVEFKNAKITASNKIKIQYNVETIGMTDDMSGYILVIEIDKNIQDFF